MYVLGVAVLACVACALVATDAGGFFWAATLVAAFPLSVVALILDELVAFAVPLGTPEWLGLPVMAALFGGAAWFQAWGFQRFQRCRLLAGEHPAGLAEPR